MATNTIDTNTTPPPSIEQQADACVARLKTLGVRLRLDGDGHYRVPQSGWHLLTVDDLVIVNQPAVLTAAAIRGKRSPASTVK